MQRQLIWTADIPSDNSLNTEDGFRIIRDVKHCQHIPVVMDLDVDVPACEDTGVLGMQDANLTLTL